MIKGNISKTIKKLRGISATIALRAGESLADEIMEEFNVLLEETPQWSGSTVVSYRIGVGGLGRQVEDTYIELPKAESAQEAFSRGHAAAVSMAKVYNIDALSSAELVFTKRGDIVITNGSPQWEVTEEGPLRPVNEPTGAFKRFEERLSNKIIEVDLGDL